MIAQFVFKTSNCSTVPRIKKSLQQTRNNCWYRCTFEMKIRSKKAAAREDLFYFKGKGWHDGGRGTTGSRSAAWQRRGTRGRWSGLLGIRVEREGALPWRSSRARGSGWLWRSEQEGEGGRDCMYGVRVQESSFSSFLFFFCKITRGLERKTERWWD